MKTIPITVNIPIEDLSPEAIQAAIIEAAVLRVLGIREITDFDEEGKPTTRTADKTYKEMRAEVGRIAAARIQTEVEAKVPAMVEEALSGTFSPMTRWGDRAGPDTTIREMIGKACTGWMEEKVEDPTDTTSRSYDKRKIPRLHSIIALEVDKQFKTAMASEVTRIGNEIKAQMAGKINAAIAEVVNRIVGTK